MGLLTEEVEIKLSPANIKHYRSLGYIDNSKLSKGNWGSIVVKTKDLQTFSCVKVMVQCDDCKEIRQITYSTYSRVNKDGKTYCHKCISKRMSGENSPNWRSDISKEERENKRSIDGYLDFIKIVLNRDNYICQCCGRHVSGKLNVHHLNGYNWCVGGRVDPKNAITLCEDCHYNFHSMYGKGDNTIEQFEEWLGNTLPQLNNGDIEKLPRSKQIYCFETQKVYVNAIEAEKELNVAHTTIYNICNGKDIYKDGKSYHCRSAKGYHFIYYDDFLKRNNDIYTSLKDGRYKKVICLTTMKIFSSIKEASEFYGAKSIYSCCINKCKYSGQLSDGTRLKWMYYDEYIKNYDDNLFNNKASLSK